MTVEELSSDEEIFLRNRFAGTKGAWLIAAGIGIVCLGSAGLALALVCRVGTLGLHSMSTAPMIIGISLIGAGWSIPIMPRKVVLNREGLWFETPQSQRCVRWDQVGCAMIGYAGSSRRPFLNVMDLNGKSIVKVDDSFERFEQMAKSIIVRIEARGLGLADRHMRWESRRNAAIMMVIGCVFASSCGAAAWMRRRYQLRERALEQNPIFAQAEIVRKFVAPNCVTQRIEYRIQSEGQSASRNVRVEPSLWDTLKEADMIPVIHVKGDPGISHLVRGEVREVMVNTPLVDYFLFALGGVLSFGFIAMGALVWFGWDIDIDSKTRKWSIKRFGTLVSKSSLP